MTENPKLIDKLLAAISAEQSAALTRLITLADEDHTRLFLVGGPVRELLLELMPDDLDVAVEGDAITLASRLADVLGRRLVKHPRFGTATVSDDGWYIDLATARRETYERPGALPTVRPSTIDDDLLRRDFTISAMAIALNGPAAGKLLDPCGGRADLAAGFIRVLHDSSFRDDATRILRAARYEARFGFRIEEATHDLIIRDVAYLDTIGPARVHRELSRVLREPEPERTLVRLAGLGALGALHPSLAFGHDLASAFGRLREIAPRGVPAAYWPLLTWHVPKQQIEPVITRLALTRRQAESVRALHTLREATFGERPGEIVTVFEGRPAATVWALAAAGPDGIREKAQEYMAHLRDIRPLLRGDDLLALGVAPGASVGEMLARLRTAKLDGEVTTRTDEERLVRDYLASNHE